MKRLLTILLVLCATAVVPVVAAPDGGARQHVESQVSSPDALGGVGRIAFRAGNADATFYIYSITGQLIKTVRVSADQSATVEMPKGFYIVKCNGQWSRKVVVK